MTENTQLQERDTASRSSRKIKRSTGTEILVIIVAITISFGIIGSIIFAQTIERFFWQIRTTTVIEEVNETATRLLKGTNLSDWQNEDVHSKIESFTLALKRELPNVLAVKVYSPTGVVTWSDIANTIVGKKESVINGELHKTNTVGYTVDNAESASKAELGKQNVLEIYSKMKTVDGGTIGFVELYFENNDIALFVNKIHYTILGSTIIMLSIGVYLVRFALRRQDDIIVRQAHELSDIVEQSPFGIYTINTAGKIISINSKMLSIINENNSSKVVGRICWDLDGIKNVCKDVPTEKAILGETFDVETRKTDLDGNETHYRYRGVPLFAEDNKTVEEVLFTVEDITDSKKLEESLKTQATMLEEGVGERTKELQNKISELEQFQRLTINRELRMTELKEKIEKMSAQLKTFGVTDSIEN